jgi:transcriptional regulator with XRE-family HTH domain
MSTMSTDPHKRRLAELIAERRADLQLTQERISERGGPSDQTVRDYEAGNIPDKPQKATLRKFDRALGWPEGTAKHTLDTGALPVITPSTKTKIDTPKDDTTVVSRETLQQLLVASTRLSIEVRRDPSAIGEHVDQVGLLAAELAEQGMNQ